MTKREVKDAREFIHDVHMLSHLLNWAPSDPDMSLEDLQEIRALRPFSNACLRFANRLNRKLKKHERKQKETR